MQLEVGAIYEGKVTGITKFGAFVEFAEGKTGMVHISEVASAFVKEITDFVKVGQSVKVKVITIGEDGKISLSMKKAEPMAENKSETKDNFQKSERRGEKKFEKRNDEKKFEKRNDEKKFDRKDNRFSKETSNQSQSARPGDFEWQAKPNSGGSFEDMMSRFKLQSDEKISDLKKNTETKRGSFATRRESRNN